MQRFKIATPSEGGGTVLYPMKDWLRTHRDHLPPGVDPDGLNSRQLRTQLVRAGWVLADTPTEVRLMPPEFQGTAAATALVSEAVEDADSADPAEIAEEESQEYVFRLERHLQQFVADNLGAVVVDGRRVHPFKAEDGRNGLEYMTRAGRIDLLAEDDQGGLVIFEFKRAKAPDAAIGHLTRYMGCIRSTIANGRSVTGVIVAPEISYELRCSATMVPNVHLLECEMSFTLKPAVLPKLHDNHHADAAR